MPRSRSDKSSASNVTPASAKRPKHLPNGVHSGIGVYDFESKTYDWLTDFGDWPIWLNGNRRLLFVSQGKLFLYDTQMNVANHE